MNLPCSAWFPGARATRITVFAGHFLWSATASDLALFSYELRTDDKGVWLELRLPAAPGFYYTLDEADATWNWQPSIFALAPAPVGWDVLRLSDPGAAYFYRVRRISKYGPPDTDGDRIDDVFEMQHPGLDPLNASDAGLDPDGDGLTFLQEYRSLFGRDIPDGQVYGREVSVFNFGAPSAPQEALSHEVSVFNGESPVRVPIVQVYGREFSVFNFGAAPGGGFEAIAREITVFNFGEPPVPIEALSRELSVFQGEAPIRVGVFETYSREFSVFNFDLPTAPLEAISREVSIFNNTL